MPARNESTRAIARLCHVIEKQRKRARRALPILLALSALTLGQHELGNRRLHVDHQKSGPPALVNAKASKCLRQSGLHCDLDVGRLDTEREGQATLCLTDG